MSCLECGGPLGYRQTKFCSRTCTNAYNGRVRAAKNAEEQAGATQRCDCCGEDLPLSMFSKPKNSTSYKTTCRSCAMKNRKKEAHRKNWEENAPLIMWRMAKQNAKKHSRPFTIEVKDVIIPEVCPVLGVPLTRSGEFSPSLDRIDSSRGYEPDNIVVVSRRANKLKRDMTLAEMRALVSFYETLS